MREKSDGAVVTRQRQRLYRKSFIIPELRI